MCYIHIVNGERPFIAQVIMYAVLVCRKREVEIWMEILTFNVDCFSTAVDDAYRAYSMHIRMALHQAVM